MRTSGAQRGEDSSQVHTWLVARSCLGLLSVGAGRSTLMVVVLLGHLKYQIQRTWSVLVLCRGGDAGEAGSGQQSKVAYEKPG